jgi:hypothetical protein
VLVVASCCTVIDATRLPIKAASASSGLRVYAVRWVRAIGEQRPVRHHRGSHRLRIKLK